MIKGRMDTVLAQSNLPTPSREPQSVQSCILYQNDDKTVTLIDIPYSIAKAQGTQQSPCHLHLLSCPPLVTPFKSNEPKSEAAKARLRAKMGSEHDVPYATAIDQALSHIKNNYDGAWCLPRYHVAPLPVARGQARKRKATELHSEDLGGPSHPIKHGTGLEPSVHPEVLEDKTVNVSQALRTLVANRAPSQRQGQAHEPGLPRDIASLQSDHYLRNPTQSPLEIEFNMDGHPLIFTIPPGSAFYLGDCYESRPFHTAVRDTAQEDDTARQFHLIVMDPPWPNSSVTRAQKTGISSYDVAPTLWDIQELIFGMDVDVLLAQNALVAVWITNKAAVRDLVLGEGGFFDTWGVCLEEEWLWIKTTNDGRPVAKTDALWRKPYEVLLLGRKYGYNPVLGQDERPAKVVRRVIAGVPDLHSRKPCLKDMLEPLMPDPANYRALEIFARYLVANWWSWGNEALKFNHKNCWQHGPSAPLHESQ